MRMASMILGACVLTLAGTGGLVLGCSAGQDGETEVVEVVDGEPIPDKAAEPDRTSEPVTARRLAAETTASLVREVPVSMELSIDPDNDFYLARALEPEPADTVHVEISATAH